MTWVLMLYFSGVNWRPVNDFPTEAACIEAGKQAEAEHPFIQAWACAPGHYRGPQP